MITKSKHNDIIKVFFKKETIIWVRTESEIESKCFTTDKEQTAENEMKTAEERGESEIKLRERKASAMKNGKQNNGKDERSLQL